MLELFIIFCAIIFAFTQFMRHPNLCVAFNIYWLIASLLYVITIGFSECILYVALGCISFTIGFLILSPQNTINHKCNHYFYLDKNRSNFVLLFYTIVLIINCIFAYSSYKLLMSGYDWNQIRGIFLSGETNISIILTKVIFATPATYMAGVVFSKEIYNHNKSRKSILIMILSALSVTAYTFASQSRFVILYFLICVLIAYKQGFKCGTIKKDTAKKIRIVLYFTGTSIFVITIYRLYLIGVEANSESAIKALVGYATISFDIMDYYIPMIDRSGVWGYGTVFWGGLIDILQNALKIFGIDNADFLLKQDEIINTINDEAVVLRNNRIGNAFASIFTYFYIDCREIGIIIGSFAFGLICSYLEKVKFKSNLWNALYFYTWVILAMTPVRWGGQMLSSTLPIVYLILLYHNQVRVSLFHDIKKKK